MLHFHGCAGYIVFNKRTRYKSLFYDFLGSKLTKDYSNPSRDASYKYILNTDKGVLFSVA